MAQSHRDSLIVKRVSYPPYLSNEIKPDDWLIDNATYQLLMKDLDKVATFKSKFAALERTNDSLYAEFQKQAEIMERLYNQADILQSKILNNQLEIIRTEVSLEGLQAKYNDTAEQIGAGEKIRYRTRYIFRDKQEKRWFWITWGIFLSVPSAIVLWQVNR